MAYVKHTWECGEAITDDKLNNIEDGIEEAMSSGGGGGIVLKASASGCLDEYACGPTSGECYAYKEFETVTVVDGNGDPITPTEVYNAVMNGTHITVLLEDEIVEGQWVGMTLDEIQDYDGNLYVAFKRMAMEAVGDDYEQYEDYWTITHLYGSTYGGSFWSADKYFYKHCCDCEPDAPL